MSLRHTVCVGTVEVLVRGDWRGQNTSGNLLHVACLLRCLRAHEVRVDRRSNLLDVDLGCGGLLDSLLLLLLGQGRLPLQELLNSSGDG